MLRELSYTLNNGGAKFNMKHSLKKEKEKKERKNKKARRTSSSLGSARWSADRWGPHRQPPSAPPAASWSSLPAPTTRRKGSAHGHSLSAIARRTTFPFLRYFLSYNTNYRDWDWINMGRGGTCAREINLPHLLVATFLHHCHAFYSPHGNSKQHTSKAPKAASLIFRQSSGRPSLFDETDGRTFSHTTSLRIKVCFPPCPSEEHNYRIKKDRVVEVARKKMTDVGH